MSNALGTLFTDIANAIRGKNGETGKMKPAEFPAKISAIETGGGEDGEVGGLLFASGEYVPTTTDAITIEHNLGVLPDIVMFFLCGMKNDTATLKRADGVTTGQIAYSTEAMEDGAQPYVYVSNTSNFAPLYSLHQSHENMDMLGMVREATHKTFKVGGSTSAPVLVGAAYRWVAIGNLKYHPTIGLSCALDGNGNLIVTGGVPEMQQLEIYVDGTLAKTVDYVHGESFTVDISDVAAEVKEYTISVKPLGNLGGYTYQFSESVTGLVTSIACNGVCGASTTYDLTDDGTLTISGTGAMDDYAYDAEASRPWYKVLPFIKKVIVSEGVTKLANMAFYNCPALTSVSLPESLTRIGMYAFSGCTSLTTLRIPLACSVLGSRFVYNSGLTSITFVYTGTWKKYTAENGTATASGIATSYLTAAKLQKTGSSGYADNWLKQT